MKSLKVLITDDNSKEILNLATYFREQGFNVKICSRNGNDILEYYLRYEPDVVITDYFLDSLDSRGVVLRISASPVGNPLIIVLSRFLNRNVTDELFSAGADIVFEKPIVPEKIVNTVFERYKMNKAMDVPKYSFCFEETDITELENAVDETLIEIGLSPKHRGYSYTKENVLKILSNSDYSRLLSKRLYPELASSHCVSTASIEKSIRLAIEHAYLNKEHNKYFYYFSYNKPKPTNIEFLNIVSQHIKTRKSTPVKTMCYVYSN